MRAELVLAADVPQLCMLHLSTNCSLNLGYVHRHPLGNENCFDQRYP